MLLRKYEELPKSLQNEKVKAYYNNISRKKGSLVLKRIFDFSVSLILLILLSPIILIIAMMIKLDSRGPIFYRQERVTIYNQTFRIFKFRTMVQNADKVGSMITTSNDSRITKVGSMIRKTRLDEIPQLINVLIGQMSFVGTRPEVRKYVDYYNDEMKATLLLPAGITSLASIKYKDEDTNLDAFIKLGKTVDEAYIEDILPDKMKYNLEYLNTFNFLGDIKLMIQTVFSVLK